MRYFEDGGFVLPMADLGDTPDVVSEFASDSAPNSAPNSDSGEVVLNLDDYTPGALEQQIASLKYALGIGDSPEQLGLKEFAAALMMPHIQQGEPGVGLSDQIALRSGAGLIPPAARELMTTGFKGEDSVELAPRGSIEYKPLSTYSAKDLFGEVKLPTIDGSTGGTSSNQPQAPKDKWVNFTEKLMSPQGALSTILAVLSAQQAMAQNKTMEKNDAARNAAAMQAMKNQQNFMQKQPKYTPPWDVPTTKIGYSSLPGQLKG